MAETPRDDVPTRPSRQGRGQVRVVNFGAAMADADRRSTIAERARAEGIEIGTLDFGAIEVGLQGSQSLREVAESQGLNADQLRRLMEITDQVNAEVTDNARDRMANAGVLPE